MNVTDMREYSADRFYALLQSHKDQRVGAFHQWWGTHPERLLITDVIVRIAEIIALDEERCAVAGYEPRPAQEILAAHQIIPCDAITRLRRSFQEARH